MPDFDSNDFDCLDGIDSVELHRQASDGSFATAIACRSVLESFERVRSDGTDVEVVVRHLPVSDVGTFGIRRGDRLRDAEGSFWAITDVALVGANDQWKVRAVRVS